jgi:Cu-processing system permease protein
MSTRLGLIAANTFREAVRDRVLYNLVFFALLMVGSAPLFGVISIGVEKNFMVNLGLAAIVLFGVVIAIFVGTGLVAKEIEKRTLYTLLARPVARCEFLTGKYLGLAATLGVNTAAMAVGFFAAVAYVGRGLTAADANLLAALYLIGLQLLVITAVALLFSSFSTPIFSAAFTFAIFVIGNFVDDMRGFAGLTAGPEGWLIRGLSYLVPNFGAMNVVGLVAHGQAVPPGLLLADTANALCYTVAALAAAILIFERRDLK